MYTHERACNLPYVKGMMDRLKRVYKKYNIALHSKPLYNIRQAFITPKDKLPADEKQEVVYSVNCAMCEKEYVGKTERPLYLVTG